MQFAKAGVPLKPDLESASDADWETASKRAHAMEKLLVNGAGPSRIAEVARDQGLSRAMVYRLLARYRRNPSPSELLPKQGGRVPGVRRLDDGVEALIQKLMGGYYLNRERPRIVDLYRQIAAECRRNDLPHPSYKAIWSRVNQLDPALKLRAREGAKAARDRFGSVSPGLRPKKPLELFQIDHTLADVIVVDEVERRPVGRPWLTLVIDVATRVVAGFHLSLDAPSSTSVALAISHAVLPKDGLFRQFNVSESWPVEGLPQVIHLDNAKEFHGQALERGCREHKITLRFRPPQTPHFGGHIERLIGTLMGDVHLLPGTTFSSVEARGEYQSEKKASLTLRDFERWLTLQIVEIYHRRVHRGIGVSPLVAWTTAVAQPEVSLRRPSDAEKFYVDFLPGEARLIRRDGIQLFGIHYWESALSPVAGRSKQKYLVRYDPRDLSHVYVKDRTGGQYIKVPYRDISNPAITQSEHRSVLKRLKKKKGLAIDEKTVFAAILEQRALVEKARKDTAAARRGREKINGVKTPSRSSGRRTMTQSLSEESLSPVEPYKVEVWE
jgi:putative transposase